MRFIPTRIHGMLDYLVGIVLLAEPWIFGFSAIKMANYLPVVLGLVTILYSLITDYEWGVVRVMPMPIHLMLDLFLGILLTVSPWLLGFSKFVYLPHLVIGLLAIVVALMSKPVPERRRGGNLVEQGHQRGQ